MTRPSMLVVGLLLGACAGSPPPVDEYPAMPKATVVEAPTGATSPDAGVQAADAGAPADAARAQP